MYNDIEDVFESAFKKHEEKTQHMFEKHVVKDINEFKQKECNCVTQEYLDNVYGGDIWKWFSDQESDFVTNKHCLNCTNCKDCTDCIHCNKCYGCNGCIDCTDCEMCTNCKDSDHSYNCNNCNNVSESEHLSNSENKSFSKDRKVFINLDEFKKYIRSFSEVIPNGCTQDFLNKYYYGNYEEWYEDNLRNEGCFNCWNCLDCVDCVECNSCVKCDTCVNCKCCFEYFNCNDINYYKDAEEWSEEWCSMKGKLKSFNHNITERLENFENNHSDDNELLFDDNFNACTQKFLNKYYSDKLNDWKHDNETNKHCTNCYKCEHCEDCTDCIKCFKCIKCKECKNCKNCKKCINIADIMYVFNKNSNKINDDLKDYEDENGNSCTQEFLDEFYDGSLSSWEEDNETNRECFNCTCCDGCYKCENCEDCKDCGRCKHCYSCDNTMDSQYCSKCDICQNLFMRYDCRLLTSNKLPKPKYIDFCCFDTYEKYKEYCTNNKANINGFSPDFMDKYYGGDVNKWYADNRTNTSCWECLGCRDCNDCKKCKDCNDCEECEKCEYCNGCKDCKNSRSCKYVSNGDNLKNCEDVEHLYDLPLSDNSKQALRITLLHKNYEEFKQAIDKLPDYIIRNGCTESFLKEYYDDDIEKFIEDNKTNKKCFNCRGCENCNNCVNCVDCYDSINLIGDKQLACVDLIEQPISELKVKYVFEGGYSDYLLYRVNERQNGCTPEFLNKYYNGDLLSYIKDVNFNGNQGCFNCKNCVDCYNCVECMNCVDCSEYEGWDGKKDCSMYVFDDYNDYMRKRIDQEQNACDQKFLDTHYDGIVFRFIDDNRTNKGCWNCWECRNCDYCTNCEDVEGMRFRFDLSYKFKCVFKDNKEYEKYISETHYKTNGCTQDFLDLYYNSDFDKWLLDNQFNNRCFNCRGCERCRRCVNCVECFECDGCYDCNSCKQCNGCNDCVNCYCCVECFNCEGCKECVEWEDGESCDASQYGNKLCHGIGDETQGLVWVFKDHKQYEKHIEETKSNINGCTQEFLNKYYDGEINKWKLDNQFNNRCFNCIRCERCKGCVECEDCEECVYCYESNFLKHCENCVECGSCENCKGCENNCFGCKYCNDCSSCVYCYNKNNLHNISGDDCKNIISKNMTSKEFKEVVDEQLEYCKNLLFKKNEEYVTTDDVFENFRTGANMLGTDVKNTLLGYLTKHLVSIISMIQDDKQYDIDKWNEKIADSINYFLLLKGMVVEEKRK